MVGFFSRCAYNTLLKTANTKYREGEEEPGTPVRKAQVVEAGKYKVGYWNLGDCIIFSILVCGEYGRAIFSLGIGLKGLAFW